MMMTFMLGDGREVQNHGSSPRMKKSMACSHCRMKKIKCNGEQPRCSNCLDRREKCVYMPLKRRYRKRSDQGDEILLDRISRLEEMANIVGPVQRTKSPDLHATAAGKVQMKSSCTNNGPEQLPIPPPHTNPAEDGLLWTTTETSGLLACTYYKSAHNTPGSTNTSTERSSTSLDVLSNIIHDRGFQDRRHISPLHAAQGRSDVSNHSWNRASENDPGLKSPMDKGLNSIPPPENPEWEYQGPGNFLSICSRAGINWVMERTGSQDFADVAKSFSQVVMRHLKLDRRMSPVRVPEPDRETAWRYTKNYFESTTHTGFDVVLRSNFEARLQVHMECGSSLSWKDDAAWYALRNVIYAHGCRVELSDTTYSSNIVEASVSGWQYFENALSRFTDLCFSRTGLMAVQALVAMSYYVEGIGSPSLEYMLCSSALRLAQAKGLHRQAGNTWGMSEQEIQHRNWIFWSIYVYEKHIAHRSGRASAIDDEDISCQIPKSVATGGTNSVEFCIAAIQHAQICSQICKRFSTVQAYRQSSEDLVTLACDLDLQLREWEEALPSSIKPDAVIKIFKIPPNLTMYHILYLHYSYFGSLIAIHSMFTCPWSGMFGRDQSERLRDQINVSTEVVAEASRNIILATKFINDINSWTPTWLAFYYPLLGLIHLFVHVIGNPTAQSVLSDIALLDVVAGHFARMEFASSGQWTICIARELSNIARVAFKKASQMLVPRAETTVGLSNPNVGSLSSNDTVYMASDQGCNVADMQARSTSGQEPDSFEYTNLDHMQMVTDFEIEDWSTLLPSFSLDGMVNMSNLSRCEGL